MTAIDVNGTTVVVTGAGRGFGRATAVALAESGAQVVGVARHRGGLEELQRELGDALSCETRDVADPEVPARLFGTYRPAAVVLNAGATPVIGRWTSTTGTPSASTGTSTSGRPSTSSSRPCARRPRMVGSWSQCRAGPLWPDRR